MLALTGVVCNALMPVAALPAMVPRLPRVYLTSAMLPSADTLALPGFPALLVIPPKVFVVALVLLLPAMAAVAALAAARAVARSPNAPMLPAVLLRGVPAMLPDPERLRMAVWMPEVLILPDCVMLISL